MDQIFRINKQRERIKRLDRVLSAAKAIIPVVDALSKHMCDEIPELIELEKAIEAA